MKGLEPAWDQVGPIPVDHELEAALAAVQHRNNGPKADESVWAERAKRDADAFASAESDFIDEMVRRIEISECLSSLCTPDR